MMNHARMPPQQELESSEGAILPPRMGSELLPPNFRPSSTHVIVGRGKEAKTHPGNIKLKSVAITYLDQYSQSKDDKETKCKIISDIIASVNEACPGGSGGFIKRCTQTGRWYQVDNSGAREKVGCLLRDMLSDKYRSSSKSKVARRQRSRQQNELKEYVKDIKEDDTIATDKSNAAISVAAQQQPNIDIRDRPLPSVKPSLNHSDSFLAVDVMVEGCIEG